MHVVFWVAVAAVVNFFRSVVEIFKDARYRALTVSVVLTLSVGTLFYRLVEGWSWLDSLYFSVITLTTVGYGDLAPSKPASKVFTILFIFAGIGILMAFLDTLARVRMERRRKRRGRGEWDGEDGRMDWVASKEAVESNEIPPV
jgi:hypothetical protein